LTGLFFMLYFEVFFLNGDQLDINPLVRNK
jgi:hypothetical protein